MHNAVMCTLSLYDVTGITRNLHIKLKSFFNIAYPLHKGAVCGCSFLYIIAKKSVIMSEAFLVDVSIFHQQRMSLGGGGRSKYILRAADVTGGEGINIFYQRTLCHIFSYC